MQIQPDGYILPRGVQGIKAEGLTIPEVTAELEAAYGKILHDPVITVLPTNVVPAYFIAGGQVKNPVSLRKSPGRVGRWFEVEDLSRRPRYRPTLGT